MVAARLAALVLLAACAGDQRASSHAGRVSAPAKALASPSYATPPGARLAFGVQDGALRNYFLRQGPAAAHVVTRSGERPRVLVAFPAEDQGIGVWFRPADGAELWAGAEQMAVSSGGGLSALETSESSAAGREAYGIRASLKSNAKRLTTELVLLGAVRTLRDYGYGVCLENRERFPELRNETFELSSDQSVLRIRREQIGAASSLELVLAARRGTRIRLTEPGAGSRPECPLPVGSGQPGIELSGEDGIELELSALSDDAPLTAIPPSELFASAVPNGLERSALAFLSYEEKLLAGSWRFLTYFGRDTLLSLWLLLPALQERVLEAGLGAVLERVQLGAGDLAPNGGTLELGDVAHEEEIGDFAAWKNVRLSPPPASLRQPRYDYEMIDDDFLLAPLLVAFSDALGGAPRAGVSSAADAAARGAAFEAFLRRTRSDGASFRGAVLANLGLVLRRARPYADDHAAPLDKKAKLVGLRPGSWVGQWRDSEIGLAFGRYPFDVNAALVPAALTAAAQLYERLGQPADALEARRLRQAWQGVEELFRFELPLQKARANVADYARSLGLADPSAELEPEASGNVIEYGIALDASSRPLPVMHSDHAFVLAFARPSEPYLQHVAGLLRRTFPAGLSSPVGVLIANPGLAEPGATVLVPKGSVAARDDVRTPLRALFTTAHYHGTVVWSWQQALLAVGLRRQLARNDLSMATRAALTAAECALWRAIDAGAAARLGELWSWAPDAQGRPEFRAFGDSTSDADESNAIQLWSTVYLAVQKPTPLQNPNCSRPSGAARSSQQQVLPGAALVGSAAHAPSDLRRALLTSHNERH
jgi:hypothetical protein